MSEEEVAPEFLCSDCLLEFLEESTETAAKQDKPVVFQGVLVKKAPEKPCPKCDQPETPMCDMCEEERSEFRIVGAQIGFKEKREE